MHHHQKTWREVGAHSSYGVVSILVGLSAQRVGAFISPGLGGTWGLIRKCGYSLISPLLLRPKSAFMRTQLRAIALSLLSSIS